MIDRLHVLQSVRFVRALIELKLSKPLKPEKRRFEVRGRGDVSVIHCVSPWSAHLFTEAVDGAMVPSCTMQLYGGGVTGLWCVRRDNAVPYIETWYVVLLIYYASIICVLIAPHHRSTPRMLDHVNSFFD